MSRAPKSSVIGRPEPPVRTYLIFRQYRGSKHHEKGRARSLTIYAPVEEVYNAIADILRSQFADPTKPSKPNPTQPGVG